MRLSRPTLSLPCLKKKLRLNPNMNQELIYNPTPNHVQSATVTKRDFTQSYLSSHHLFFLKTVLVALLSTTLVSFVSSRLGRASFSSLGGSSSSVYQAVGRNPLVARSGNTGGGALGYSYFYFRNFIDNFIFYKSTKYTLPWPLSKRNTDPSSTLSITCEWP